MVDVKTSLNGTDWHAMVNYAYFGLFTMLCRGL